MDHSSLIVFALGDNWFAVPTAIVEEVSDDRKIHQLPHRQGHPLFGVANLHGNLLACVSLEDLLAIVSVERYRTPLYLTQRAILINLNEERWIIPVSKVLGIFPLGHQELSPSSAAYGTNPLIKGMIDLEEKCVACIDQEKLFTALHRSSP
jgi:chemotaxis-related protein WspD